MCDSKLEARIARALHWNPNVVAYVKNDRLYFDIPYQYLGRTHRYRPDFIVRLGSGLHVLVEGKGSPTEADDAESHRGTPLEPCRDHLGPTRTMGNTSCATTRTHSPSNSLRKPNRRSPNRWAQPQQVSVCSTLERRHS